MADKRCEVCGAWSGSSCLACGRSLGCRRHGAGIVAHMAADCLATAAEMADVEALVLAGASIDMIESFQQGVRERAPRPWPVPIGVN